MEKKTIRYVKNGSKLFGVVTFDTIETPTELWGACLQGPILMEFRSREDGESSRCEFQ
jgi:hypothetical protein